MPNPLSTLGVVHTLISLVAVAAGLYLFLRYRRIDVSTGAGKVFRLVEALEDLDDVQNVFANFDVSDDVMAELDA